jgi:hypothetical protein
VIKAYRHWNKTQLIMVDPGSSDASAQGYKLAQENITKKEVSSKKPKPISIPAFSTVSQIFLQSELG